MRPVLATPLLLLMPLLLSGCAANCSGSQGLGGQQGVCNEGDSFYFGKQGSFMGTETHTWQNSGTKATVAWGGQGTGTVTVKIKDAAGKEVFSKDFSGAGQAGGTHATQVGKAGAWTITISAKVAFQGQVGVAVNKA